mmetsp:Transcript_110407/g.352002  ORF Transcript_110407/g.352002 Transcript_110407/m.352002 type:complete len:206 (+) Transcript_110407:647-1264(+)
MGGHAAQFNSGSGRLVGNTPRAWTHMVQRCGPWILEVLPRKLVCAQETSSSPSTAGRCSTATSTRSRNSSWRISCRSRWRSNSRWWAPRSTSGRRCRACWGGCAEMRWKRLHAKSSRRWKDSSTGSTRSPSRTPSSSPATVARAPASAPTTCRSRRSVMSSTAWRCSASETPTASHRFAETLRRSSFCQVGRWRNNRQIIWRALR